jgi:hypothetical protein
MALQSSGPITFEDINDELGEGSTNQLDLETAASNFSGIRDTETTPGYGALAVEMREFYGKSYSAGSGTYGTRNAHTIRFLTDGASSRAYGAGELVHAAEAIAAQTSLGGAVGTTNLSKFVDDYIDNDLTVGDDIYNASTGTAVFDISGHLVNSRPGDSNKYYCDDTADKVFRLQSSGNVSVVFDRKPATPTISLVSKTNTSITINIVGDTRVARTIRTYEGSNEATLTSGSFTAGNSTNTNITKEYTYSSLSAGQSYALKARYENAFTNGDDSNTLNITTNAGATAFSNPFTDFTISGTDDTSTSQEFESSEKTIDLANASGDTTIECQQPSDSDAQLVVKGGTSSGNYGSYGESITLGEASTYYLKFKLVESRTSQTSNQLASEIRLITIINNSVQAVGSSGGVQKPKITIEIAPPREGP